MNFFIISLLLFLLLFFDISNEAYIKIEQVKWTQEVNEEFVSYQKEIYKNKTLEVGIYTFHKNLKNLYVSIF